MRSIKQTPDAMVVDGKPHEGHFKTPFRNMNLDEARLFGPLGRVAPALGRIRLKEWEHIGVAHEDAYFGMLIFDGKYLGSSFWYIFDRKSGRMLEYERLVPLSVGIKLARELWNDVSYIRLPGHRIEIFNRLDQGRIEFEFNIAARGGKPPATGRFTFFEDPATYQPMIVSLPLGDNRVMYSHKAIRPVEGRIEADGRVFELDPQRDYAMLDVHKSYYPYETWWKWATFGFRDRHGRLVGMNLTRNIVGDSDKWNENGLWVDDKLSLLPGVEFDFDEKDVLKPWNITVRDGRAKLRFEPVGERKQFTNAGLIVSDYRQPFGVFNGYAVDDDGKRHEIVDAFGVAEDHRARF